MKPKIAPAPLELTQDTFPTCFVHSIASSPMKTPAKIKAQRLYMRIKSDPYNGKIRFACGFSSADKLFKWKQTQAKAHTATGKNAKGEFSSLSPMNPVSQSSRQTVPKSTTTATIDK